MNAKKTVTNKKQTVAVKDLKTKKNPKGGAVDAFIWFKAPQKGGSVQGL